MATVQTLKDKNNETFYPVTKTEAVYNADGSETLDTTIDNFSNVVQNLSDTKATISTSASDANKMMKADGTKALVGSDNIDFTSLITEWTTVASQSGFSVEYEKFGPIVFVRGHSNNAVSIPADSSYTELATLPNDCIPSKQVLGFVSLLGGTQSASRYFRIGTDGSVSIYNRNNGTDTSFSYWEFFTCFMAA